MFLPLGLNRRIRAASSLTGDCGARTDHRFAGLNHLWQAVNAKFTMDLQIIGDRLGVSGRRFERWQGLIAIDSNNKSIP